MNKYSMQQASISAECPIVVKLMKEQFYNIFFKGSTHDFLTESETYHFKNRTIIIKYDNKFLP